MGGVFQLYPAESCVINKSDIGERINMGEKIKEIIFSVAGITFFAYACTYAYYAGCFGYYGIPETLLKVDMNYVLQFTREKFLVFLLMVAVLFFNVLRKEKLSKRTALTTLVMIFCIEEIIAEPSIGTIIGMVIVGAGIFVFYFAMSKKQIENTKEKLFVAIMFVLYLLYLILSTMYGYGKCASREQIEYFAIQGNSNSIILQESNEFFITGKYDNANHRFEQDFCIVGKEGQEIKLITIEK